jgi:hypothetical protein
MNKFDSLVAVHDGLLPYFVKADVVNFKNNDIRRREHSGKHFHRSNVVVVKSQTELLSRIDDGAVLHRLEHVIEKDGSDFMVMKEDP